MEFPGINIVELSDMMKASVGLLPMDSWLLVRLIIFLCALLLTRYLFYYWAFSKENSWPMKLIRQ